VNEIRDAGGEISGLAGDIGKAEDARRIVAAAVERYGRTDVLVNNASLLGSRVTIADYPIADWDEVVRVNLTGVFLLTQQVLQVMIPQRQGSIINVSSGVGRAGKARWGAYACSKAGLEGFTQDHLPPGSAGPAGDWVKWLFGPPGNQRLANVRVRLSDASMMIKFGIRIFCYRIGEAMLSKIWFPLLIFGLLLAACAVHSPTFEPEPPGRRRIRCGRRRRPWSFSNRPSIPTPPAREMNQ
jgi:hypothetical protein